MYFGQGSYFNDGEYAEPDDDLDQEFVQDVLQNLDDDQNLHENDDFGVLHGYFSFTSSDQSCLKDPDKSDQNEEINECDPSDSLNNSDFTNSSPHPDFSYQIKTNSFDDLKNSFHDPNNPHCQAVPQDSGFSFQEPFMQDCYNGPPNLPKANESLNPSLNSFEPGVSDLTNSSNYSFDPNFNKGNAASAVPNGNNASFFIQAQSNQYHSSQNLNISYVSAKTISNRNQSSFRNFKKMNLSKIKGSFESNSEAIHMSQNSPSKQFDRYLKLMVLADQQDVGKDLKIIIFNFFREYLRSTHPYLLKRELLPLTRDEKRYVALINRRILAIKDHIIYNFNNNKKETLLPVVERYSEFILKNHKKKGTKFARILLEKINSLKML